jgi:cytochrome c nitrite reductase small subunit
MNEQYDARLKSGHRHTATCVECHLPHEGLAKWVAKAEHGFRHSVAFTLQNFKEPIEITARDRRMVQDNCVRCHAAFVRDVLPITAPDSRAVHCLHCHAGAGHGAGR